MGLAFVGRRHARPHGLLPTNANENTLVTPSSFEPSRECQRAVPDTDTQRFSRECPWASSFKLAFPGVDEHLQGLGAAVTILAADEICASSARFPTPY